MANRRIGELINRPVAVICEALLVCLYGVPLLWVVLTSLKSSSQIYGSGFGLIFHPTFAAYSAVGNSTLLSAVGNSAMIAGGAMIVTLALAVPCSYALARQGGKVLTIGLGIIIFLQTIPTPATLIPLYQIFTSWGLLGTRTSVVVADCSVLLPFAILILRPFFHSVPYEIEEAARVDGAGVFRVFGRIALPMARNGIATSGLIVFLIAWGDFLFAITFLSDPSKYPLGAIFANQVSQYGVNWSNLMAIATVTSLPVLIIFVAGYRLLRAGLRVGAIR